jgi:hypothetical protein
MTEMLIGYNYQVSELFLEIQEGNGNGLCDVKVGWAAGRAVSFINKLAINDWYALAICNNCFKTK